MTTPHEFLSREQAASMLGEKLLNYKGTHPLILAIPRGSVPMGRVIATMLDGELDLVLTHKLSAPFDPEYAIGAIDESGWTYLSPYAADISDDYIEEEKRRQLETLHQRRIRFSPHKLPVDPQGRVVIVIDDGLATGATMIAALHAVRARHPQELICAVPVAAPESLRKVDELADKTVCLYAPANFMGVGQFYRYFPQVEEEEVIEALSTK